MTFNLLKRVENDTNHNQQRCSSKELCKTVCHAADSCERRHDRNNTQED